MRHALAVLVTAVSASFLATLYPKPSACAIFMYYIDARTEFLERYNGDDWEDIRQKLDTIMRTIAEGRPCMR